MPLPCLLLLLPAAPCQAPPPPPLATPQLLFSASARGQKVAAKRIQDMLGEVKGADDASLPLGREVLRTRPGDGKHDDGQWSKRRHSAKGKGARLDAKLQ